LCRNIAMNSRIYYRHFAFKCIFGSAVIGCNFEHVIYARTCDCSYLYKYWQESIVFAYAYAFLHAARHAHALAHVCARVYARGRQRETMTMRMCACIHAYMRANGAYACAYVVSVAAVRQVRGTVDQSEASPWPGRCSTFGVLNYLRPILQGYNLPRRHCPSE